MKNKATISNTVRFGTQLASLRRSPTMLTNEIITMYAPTDTDGMANDASLCQQRRTELLVGTRGRCPPRFRFFPPLPRVFSA